MSEQLGESVGDSVKTVGLVGYGRFGRTLGALLSEAGRAHRAFDPRGAVPPEVVATSLVELAAACRTLVLAVPLGAMRDVLVALRPVLTPAHTVFDVGSVKLLPSAAMADVLGAAVPWVATHPLFGPSSIALGERPLRVVICPNARHPAAVTRVTALYRELGCLPEAQDADAHDRAMAHTHALTYFITKGMLEIGIDQQLENAPPSFRAMARTIEAVRSDAGHLFTALHRENPHAGPARQRFLAALLAADQALTTPADASSPDVDVEAAEIPVGLPHPADAQPDGSADLARIRRAIDDGDRQLLALLERRARLALHAGEVKARLGREVLDASREERLLADRTRWGAELGLDAEAIEEIFGAILRVSKRIQTLRRGH